MPTNRLDPTFLGNLTSNLFFSNGIGGFDTEDDYRINLTSISNINISVVSQYALNFQISLIRDTNNNGVIDDTNPRQPETLAVASTSSIIGWYGKHSDNIASLAVANLSPGNYYVRVSTSASNFSAYQISLSPFNLSNLIAEEVNWGNLSSSAVGVDGYLYLDAKNLSDFYRFNLTTAGDINLHNMSSPQTFFRLIRDNNNNRLVEPGEVIMTSPSAFGYSRSINLSNQAAGTYFVQVYLDMDRYSADNYDLRASTSDPSNLLDKEDYLEPSSLSTTITKTGTINNTDTSDFYFFRIENYNKNINLSLTGLAADADLRLIRDLDNNHVADPGEILAVSTSIGSRPDVINLYNQPIGAYFVQVYQYGASATDYTLRSSSTIPNNLLAEEDTLGVFVGQTLRTGFVGRNDTSDIYRITIIGSRRISARLSGMTGDADLRLIRDINNNNLMDLSGEYVVGSATGGTTEETFNQLVPPGEYFLQVTSYGANETNYNLNVSVF